LRQDHHTKITLKKPTEKTIKGLRVRHEFETTVGDWETMDAILKGLGYRHGLYYEKYRTVYTLPDIEQAEIVVDELPFGNFVEIEGEAEAIDTIIHRLHLTECHRIRTNYAGLLKAVVQAQNLDFEHATFDNFAGIEVDTSIFETL
jgi:adenylate cyclase class 2